MSCNSLSLTPAGNWRGRNGHGDTSPDQDPEQRWSPSVPWPLYYRQEEERSVNAPWRLFEERVRTGPYGLVRFPWPPHSPVRIFVLGGPAQRMSPSLRQFIQDSPLRSRDQWQVNTEKPSRLTNEEFKKAMKMLRKQIYSTSTNKARKKGLFRKWNNKAEELNVEKGEEKACPVCLETFKSNEEVMVTPCDHIFHHDCIVPWVKSSGHCPVCRFAFCERSRTMIAAPQNNNGYSEEEENLLPVDAVSLIRAMEEAFNWVALSE